MSADTRVFVAWEERIISQERGNRIVHFYLKDSCGDYVLAVVGTERSIRHMMYVVSDEFLRAYGSEKSTKMCTKWRARREVVEWLTALVSNHCTPVCFLGTEENKTAQALASLKFTTNEFQVNEIHQDDHKIQISRKFKVHNTSEIGWSGVGWICGKQLRHYPAFCRNGAMISVHSFVYVLAEEGTNHLGYLEDLYEDKKGQKKVKVRWFLHKKEVGSVISQLNPHPREVFITPHVQVISAECIDGPAAVLTPKHYEKCLAVVPHTSSSATYMCFRQLKNNKFQPFTLTKLRGYSNQAILSCLDCGVFSKHNMKCLEVDGIEEDLITHGDIMRHSAMRNTNCKVHDSVRSGVKASGLRIQKMNSELTRQNLKFRILRRPTGIKLVRSQPQYPLSFRVNDKIELLCQDSGIRGCWFRCNVLHTCQKKIKVQYEDVQNVDGSGNLEEWVPASRVAFPDKLGMRCLGRLTTRPRPTEDSPRNSFEVGSAVDVWWSDGWWEGIVCGVAIPEDGGVQVYVPGEEMFLMLQRKNVRTSRDWVSNKWIDIKAKPDLLSRVCASIDPCKKSSMCSSVAKASDFLDSEMLDHKMFTALNLEEVEEKQERPGSSTSGGKLEVERQLKLRKRYRDDDEEEFHNGAVDKVSDYDEENDDNNLFSDDDDHDEKNSNKNYDTDNTDDDDEENSVMEEDLELANQMSEVVEAAKGSLKLYE